MSQETAAFGGSWEGWTDRLQTPNNAQWNQPEVEV